MLMGVHDGRLKLSSVLLRQPGTTRRSHGGLQSLYRIVDVLPKASDYPPLFAVSSHGRFSLQLNKLLPFAESYAILHTKRPRHSQTTILRMNK